MTPHFNRFVVGGAREERNATTADLNVELYTTENAKNNSGFCWVVLYL